MRMNPWNLLLYPAAVPHTLPTVNSQVHTTADEEATAPPRATPMPTPAPTPSRTPAPTPRPTPQQADTPRKFIPTGPGPNVYRVPKAENEKFKAVTEAGMRGLIG